MIIQLAQEAKQAANILRLATTDEKNHALELIAQSLEKERDAILRANERDVRAGRKNNLPEALIDRLSLEGGRLEEIVADLRHVTSLPDPVGEILEEQRLPSGLLLRKKRVPIGVLGVIYEARPNVTVDVASLALKTGNCALLRGGKETLRSNRALVDAIHAGLTLSTLPKEAIGLIASTSRSQVKQLLKLEQYVDMIIPRGGEGLHKFCREESLIPVITGGMGICHLYVDASADLKRALEVIDNAKTQRPSVCNALDTLLVHREVAASFIPEVIKRLEPKNVSFRLDPEAWKITQAGRPAEPQDWRTEWLSLVLGIKIVDSLEEAIAHIQSNSTGHSDGILTNTEAHAKAFVEAVDSASVYINASTRFTDGGQFGLGAEVAVSTQKLHARGPMGLKELTTYKWIIEGDYHIRS
ncbi:MAG: glutamate-5-semialdehyde dehydrogenase [Chlamydiales bacterium]|nr:glutamate-5-semialdehyde dehydrogenase [Chlamydiales bacterium]